MSNPEMLSFATTTFWNSYPVSGSHEEVVRVVGLNIPISLDELWPYASFLL